MISPGKLPRNFLSHKNPNNEHCPINKPLCGSSSDYNCFAANEKKEKSLKSKAMKIKASYFTKA